MRWGKQYEEDKIISKDILIYICNDAFNFLYSALVDFPNCACPKCSCHEYILVTNAGASALSEVDMPRLITQTMLKTFPISILCCAAISALFSYFFSRGITTPILSLSKSANQMLKLEPDAKAIVSSTDEIGALATDINNLYQSLLLTIRNLELEKEKVSLAEKEKIDFLRTASHELKTPVTELNATLENMILGIGEYRDYETYLPKCKEITEQLGDMIRDILNA